MCYFYHGTDGKVHRITASTPVVWKEDGNIISSPSYTAEMDYLIVRSDVATTPNKKTYTLTLPAGVANNAEELRIAKFEVEYVPLLACGPSTTTLISTQRINNNYESLANISFDNQSTHLPWGESSYGYVYSTGELASTKYKRGANQGVFPFYGEYTIVSSVSKDWARQNAHSGKALYVDGTMDPGLVASIYTDAVICSGQTLTCSAWFCNPTPAGWNSEGNPIFRCNVQGRDNDNAPWEDVGVYFVGELLKASGWQQVVFPIQSDKSYAQTRVSIYNFATTNLGNDFMVDDICLFVSPLPLAAYQGEMACHSTSDGGGAETTQAAAVLRLDYSNMDANASPYVYYQIYNKEENSFVSARDGGQYSVHSAVWMILGGVAEGEEGARILRSALASADSLKPVTPYMHHYVIEAMLKLGLEAEAVDYLGNYWGGMVELSADTFFEAFVPGEPDFSPYGDRMINSMCHAWSCTPSYFIRRLPDKA